MSATQRILAGGPILTVRHESDGQWRFEDAASLNKGDTESVELGRLVEKQPWIVEFADLPAGWVAWREHVMAPWERKQA